MNKEDKNFKKNQIIVNYGENDVNSVVIKNLSFKYANSNRYIFKNINIEVPPGQFVCLLGQSGCGKSTLLKLLSGLEKQTDGEIYLGGVLHKGPNLRKGVVFQDYGLFPWLSAIDNVILGAGQRYPNKTKEEIRNIAIENLRRVGLNENVFDLLPKELSGGMQQRCSIARAYSLDSPYLLMDEPFGALDAITRANLQDLVLNLWRESNPKKTIFFVTHDVDEALLLAEKIYILGQEGNDIIFETEVSHDQRFIRYKDPSKENSELRSILVNEINKDIEKKMSEDKN